MTLSELQAKVDQDIDDLKNHGNINKENTVYDHKLQLNSSNLEDPVEIFMCNFARDILAFSNSDGGIIMIGIHEDKESGKLHDKGLDETNIRLLDSIDLKKINDKFNSITGASINLSLQPFQIGTRKLFYLLIEKQLQVLIPIKDSLDYKIKKGEIYFRTSSTNKIANYSAQEFNSFLQLKANERNKEFMEIWSKLLPEMFDINPREVLMINPKINKIYGFNGKENTLSSSDIAIDKSENGVFNVILNAISAGEIGKISNNEGKPIYKLIGEIIATSPKEHITLSTLHTEIMKKSIYKVSQVHLKQIITHLKWTTTDKFDVKLPKDNEINSAFSNFLWIENFDKIKGTRKVVFSENAINPILEIANNGSLHFEIFGRNLNSANTSKPQK